MVDTRPAARCTTISSLATLAATALLASSCGWLSGDIYPNWLPYVEARADIAAAAAEAGIGALRNLDAVEYVSFIDPADGVDKSRMLAYIKGLGGEALVAFEPVGMGVVKPWPRSPISGELFNALNSKIIQTPEGFIAGSLAFSMDNLDANPVPLSGGFTQDSIVLAMGSPVKYYVLRAGYDELVMANQFKIQMFNDTFTTVTDTVRTLTLTGTGNYLVDAQYYGNSDLSEGRFRILVRTDTGAQAFSFVSDAASVLAPDAPEITGPIPMGDSTAWMTAGGVVTINHDQNTYLTRYEYGWTAAKTAPTDQLQITGDTEAYRIMSFDASGSWWYLYDQLTEQLYALRTWW